MIVTMKMAPKSVSLNCEYLGLKWNCDYNIGICKRVSDKASGQGEFAEVSKWEKLPEEHPYFFAKILGHNIRTELGQEKSFR